MPSPVLLDHRAVISVSGEDAASFLQGLLTNATLDLGTGARRYAALLTAQGKVIADMILERSDDGFLLDCDAGVAAVLLKRLNMFKLRARVAIEARPDTGIIAFDGAPDPRSADAPHRRFARRDGAAGDVSDYHAARIAAGVPEQGVDFASEEVFPADVNIDLNDGVDFRKGCFVGQEVVSRMKRRGVARRRTLLARLSVMVEPPCAVRVGDFEIGTLTSAQGMSGLVRVRIDRMAEAQRAGQAITADGATLTFERPDWLAGELAALETAKDARA